MSHEFDHIRIEECIDQVKQKRAKHMAEVWGPAVKKAIGGLFVLLAVILPLLKAGSRS